MRIVLLSQWCAPEPDVRVASLARELVKLGHEVTVLTGFPNYPHGRLYPGYRLKLWQHEELYGAKIVRVLLYPDHSQSKVKRVLNYFSFASFASILGPLMSGSIDVMWVYHPPLTVAIPALWISLLRRVPFVYGIMDMWPETLIATGMVRDGVGIRLLEKFAHFVYRHAAALTVVSPGFKDNLIQKGVSPERIHVIPNGADENIFRPVDRDPDLGEQYNLIGHFNILFGGNMGPAQSLEMAIEAAALLIDLPEVKFTFVGDGISVSDLKAQAAAKNLTNVQFVGQQPMAEMARFHSWADVLLVQLRDEPLFHITIPSKILAYLASGRPILCAVPGDGADVVREAKAGLICLPNDPRTLAAKVRELYLMPADERERMGQNGRRFFLEQFSSNVLVCKYEAVFNHVIQNKRNPQKK
ncbi:glycosyltransferase family 4 protein [Aggregatilinea lenta]|uniref:glycosyltransferase family 4 protein n=1 Tax=Aggregatilinea lenta TaxID=913108 RepID=UPI000E5AFD45|nr:glycosyltransferase family 4 protein [Aggregatilinea lenta]